MDTVVVILLVAIAAVVAILAITYARRREHERALRRDKLDGVVEGHTQMADAHAGSLDELRPQARAHRKAAVDHTRKAEELEQRIEREERQERFHAERAAQTRAEREQV